jgi:hypothetical protein
MSINITYLVHGFNVRDGGENTVEVIRPYAIEKSGGVVLTHAYGWLGLIGVLIKNKKVAKSLKERVNSDLDELPTAVGAIGHSNGCAIIIEAVRQGAKIDTLLLINPALKINTKFPKSIRKIIVVHTKHDKPTKAARFFDRIPFIQWLIPNAWGAMGAMGAKNPDKRVHNIDLSYDIHGHSDIFSQEKAKKHLPALCEIFYMPDGKL